MVLIGNLRLNRLPKMYTLRNPKRVMYTHMNSGHDFKYIAQMFLPSPEVLKLSVLSDTETSGPTLIQVLLVQMSERGLRSCYISTMQD